MQQHGLLGESPEDIARFFHENAGLDKIQLGDYMGDEHAFNKKVLYAFVEQLDFSGMGFDEAIRSFVQGFRLPGEAQKIDRMMEKFAEQYHRHNPGRFSSADTAYVLAYSVIMLNTDAHNPGVKVRMTKEDFFKNNRGIDDGKDIDSAFMGEIYDRITKNEIKMKDDPLMAEAGRGKPAAPTSQKKRFTAFVKESQQMVRRTQELIKTKAPTGGNGTGAGSGTGGDAGINSSGGSSAAFKAGARLSTNQKKYLEEISQDHLDQPENAAPTPSSATGMVAATAAAAASASSASGTSSSASNGGANGNGNDDGVDTRPSLGPVREKQFYEATDADAEAIRPMFEILAFPSLATFSVQLESSDSEQVIRLCLQGYRSAIRIANALEMQTLRLAFISSLKQFTFIGSGKQMQRKNIEAIAALLSLGSTAAEGNHLKQNWFEVLQVISEVERMHLIATNSLRGREQSWSQELVSGTGAGLTGLVGSSAVLSASAVARSSSNSGSGMNGGGGGSGGANGSSNGVSTETLNSLQVHLIDSSAIDRVFACSAHLDGEAIVDFVQALRQVSEQELASTSAPRVFSLQKMVEITYYNMGRIRVVWNRIWALLSEYFQRAGCHPHINVSMYAIDSLRQLAMKFLEKDELSSFQFQKLFFKSADTCTHSHSHSAHTLTCTVRSFASCLC